MVGSDASGERFSPGKEIMPVYGFWWGGVNYGQPYVEDLEEFDNVEAAKDALIDRARNGHWWAQEFKYVFKPSTRALTPCADEGAEMRVYLSDPIPNGMTDAPDYTFVLNDEGEAVQQEF